MLRTAFTVTLISFIISSCKVTEKDFIGFYRLVRSPKATLKIHSDKTFEFSKNNRNPYLHPFDHPDEYYADTRGTWERLDKRTISLTSQRDSIIYPLVSVESHPARDQKQSYFTFFDAYADTVKILYVQYSDSSILAVLHSSMDYFTEDLSKRDTFEFHFYGYRPYTFISGQRTNQDYKISLKPVFQPNFFRDAKFRIKRKQLIDINRKGYFRQENSGM